MELLWIPFYPNGPFVITKYNPDYEVLFEKSPTYWDLDRTISSTWAYRVIPDISANIQLFREGSLAQVNVPPTYLKVFKDSPELNTFLTHGGTASSTTFIKWNLSTKKGHTPVNPEVTGDPFFRRAISYAIQRKGAIETQGMGHSTPAGDVFSSALRGFSDENNNRFKDYLYQTEYTSPSGNYHSSMLQFDPTLARKFPHANSIQGILKDRYHNIREARWNINRFIQRHPQYKNKKIPLKLLFDTSERIYPFNY